MLRTPGPPRSRSRGKDLDVAVVMDCLPLQHDEVDILGLDGHIYKGRMDTRLPGIITKDSEYLGSSEVPLGPCLGPKEHSSPGRLGMPWATRPWCRLLCFPASRCSGLSKSPQVSVCRWKTAFGLSRSPSRWWPHLFLLAFSCHHC